MPYGYYQFAKLILFIGLGYLAYVEYTANKNLFVPVYAIGAILFNPLIKFAFNRAQWQVIDKLVIAALVLFICHDLILLYRNKYLNLL